MRDYQAILHYINYFNDDSIDFCKWRGGEKDKDGVITMPYPDYDDKLLEFIKLVYDSGLMMEGYLDLLKEKYGTENEANDIIKSADFDPLRAILTYFVRQERFCDGIWEQAVKDKIFLNILYKLKEITA